MQGKYKYLAKNTILFTISSFGSKLMTFLLVPLYTNILSTSDYGTADIISTTATLCIYVFTLSIANAVMRFTLDDVEHSDRVLYYGFSILLKGTVIMAFGTAAIWRLDLIDWEPYCYIFLVGIFFSQALEQILLNYLRASEKLNAMVTASLLSTGTKLLANIVTLVFLQWGIVGYLLSMMIGSMVACLYSFFYIFPLPKSDVCEEKNRKLHKEMRNYAIPAAVNSIGWWITNSVDRYFLVWLKGAAINGVYSVSYKIPSIMSTLCTIFSQAWTLSAVKEYNPQTKKDENGFFENMYGLLSAVMMLTCSILIFCNVWIARILFAKEFFEAWKYSSILLVTSALNGTCVFFGGIFSAAKHNREMAITMMVSTVVNIVLSGLLIPQYSALGAAIATLISYYLIWIMRYLMSRKYLKFRINLMREHVVLMLLLVQIAIEHQEGHFYLLQSCVVVLIGALYYKEVKFCFKKLRTTVSYYLKKNFK